MILPGRKYNPQANARAIDLDVAHLSGSAPVYEITTDNADHAIRGAAMILE